MKIWKVIAVLLVLSAFGWMFADTAKKKFQFEGQIDVEWFQKIHNTDIWQPVDKLPTPHVTFICEVGKLSYKNDIDLKTDYRHVGVTEGGNRVLIQLAQPATAHLNPTTGNLTLDLIFRIEADRIRTQLPIKLTTETAQTPSKVIHGKPVHWDANTGTLLMALVGGGIINTKGPADPPSRFGQASISKLADVLITVQGEGQMKQQP